MSQLHGSLATTQLPPAVEITWANGLGARFSLIPIDAAFDCSCVISETIQEVPVAYGRLKLIPCPLLIPAPHSPAPEPGLMQVLTPFGTTFQPLLVSSDLALLGLNGNWLPDLPCGDSHWVAGTDPTGPTVTFP